MAKAIEQLAMILDASKERGSIEDHIVFVTSQFDKILSLANSRGFADDVAIAVFDYILNHHYFDIDRYSTLETLINVVFEMICPFWEDDERSCIYLKYLTKRLHGNH